MKTIPLSQGKFALVDDELFDELDKHNWCASRGSKTFYAMRFVWLDWGRKASYSMHREVFRLLGEDILHTVDHIDRNGLNNQRHNLRDVTRAENNRNQSERVARTRVVNIRNSKFDVYIGRPSDWGNPFEIGPDGTREEVIEKYREYIKQRPDLQLRFNELLGKRLGCYCRPRPCHGDVLVEMVERTFRDVYQRPQPEQTTTNTATRVTRFRRS